jgi:hypothetical protein
LEPTAVRGKVFEINDLNHSAKDSPYKVMVFWFLFRFNAVHEITNHAGVTDIRPIF